MIDATRQCQAGDCAGPAVLKIRGVGLCDQHLDLINAQLNGVAARIQELTAQAVLALTGTDHSSSGDSPQSGR